MFITNEVRELLSDLSHELFVIDEVEPDGTVWAAEKIIEVLAEERKKLALAKTVLTCISQVLQLALEDSNIKIDAKKLKVLVDEDLEKIKEKQE